MHATPASDRVRVRRSPKRGVYEGEVIREILDAGMLCHLGYVVDEQPYVIPTLYGRAEDHLYVHGSAASRALIAGAGLPVCITITHLDGLVLARSLFNHSANYRSVVIIGQAHRIDDEAQKIRALRVITEHLLPGRWNEARAPTAKELRATTVLQLDMAESSAKVRAGPPNDDLEDLALDVWAGLLPVETTRGLPIPDTGSREDMPLPKSVQRWLKADHG